MIRFTYTNEHYEEYQSGVKVEVTTDAEHLEAVVRAFKNFLLHLGHRPDNVERVVFEEKQQGLPQQLELFPEDRS